MNKVIRKLKSRRGETLTEMLVSIVILGLSISMMVTMIITSTRMTEQTTTKDEEYQNQLSAAEKQDGKDGKGEEVKVEDGTVTISPITNPGEPVSKVSPIKITVEIYGNDGSLKSYKVKH